MFLCMKNYTYIFILLNTYILFLSSYYLCYGNYTYLFVLLNIYILLLSPYYHCCLNFLPTRRYKEMVVLTIIFLFFIVNPSVCITIGLINNFGHFIILYHNSFYHNSLYLPSLLGLAGYPGEETVPSLVSTELSGRYLAIKAAVGGGIFVMMVILDKTSVDFYFSLKN